MSSWRRSKARATLDDIYSGGVAHRPATYQYGSAPRTGGTTMSEMSSRYTRRRLIQSGTAGAVAAGLGAAGPRAARRRHHPHHPPRRTTPGVGGGGGAPRPTPPATTPRARGAGVGA